MPYILQFSIFFFLFLIFLSPILSFHLSIIYLYALLFKKGQMIYEIQIKVSKKVPYHKYSFISSWRNIWQMTITVPYDKWGRKDSQCQRNIEPEVSFLLCNFARQKWQGYFNGIIHIPAFPQECSLGLILCCVTHFVFSSLHSLSQYHLSQISLIIWYCKGLFLCILHKLCEWKHCDITSAYNDT